MERYLWDIAWVVTPEGVEVRLEGTTCVWKGRYATFAEAQRGLWLLLRRWQRAARARGGWLWRPHGDAVAVCLPMEVPVRGAKVWQSAACSRAGSGA